MHPIVRRSVFALLVAAGALPAAGVDDLGTLFTTPEERARLDRLRRGDPVEAQQVDGVVRSHRPRVTGYVQRSDGRNTVWIDGRPVVVAAPDARVLLQPDIVKPMSPEPAAPIEESVKPER